MGNRRRVNKRSHAEHKRAASRDVSPLPLAVGRREAALLLTISERLLWTWTNSGRIPHVRIGSRVLYPIELLRVWLQDNANSAGN